MRYLAICVSISYQVLALLPHSKDLTQNTET